MLANRTMDLLLPMVVPAAAAGLPGDLREEAARGWQRGPDGLVTLGEAPPRSGSASPEELMEAERAFHDFGIDDCDLPPAPAERSSGLGDERLHLVAGRAFAFARACLAAGRSLPEYGDLTALVSVAAQEGDLRTAAVRFFVRRGGLPACYADLDDFRFEAMALFGPGDPAALQ